MWLESRAFARACAEAAATSEPLPPARREPVEARYALCPACGRIMDRVAVGGAAGVTLDACPRDGVWLDEGELENLRRLAQTDELIRLEAAHRSAALFNEHRRRIPFGRDLSCMGGKPNVAADLARPAVADLLGDLLGLLGL